MLTSDEFSYATSADALWRRGLIRCIEHVTGKPRLYRLYLAYCRGPASGDFFAEAVRRLDLRVRTNADAIAAIPRHGPLVVVANHPFGVVDGLVLGYLISRVRGDFKILVHSALYRRPELRPYLLPIDFSETRAAVQANLQSRRTALRDLAARRTIAIFPGGGFATAPHPLARATDLEWKTFVARLVHEGRATVLPVYFDGQNSRLFQCASRISMELRASLLFHEATKMIGREVRAHVGMPIPYHGLAPMTDRRALTAHLRAATYALGPVRPAPAGPRRARAA
jgi:putative hemolysin